MILFLNLITICYFVEETKPTKVLSCSHTSALIFKVLVYLDYDTIRSQASVLYAVPNATLWEALCLKDEIHQTHRRRMKIKPFSRDGSQVNKQVNQN